MEGFLYFMGINFVLTFVAAILCVCFAPTAAGPGIPEIKAYLNGVDTPNMYGATVLFVKVSLLEEIARLLSIFFNTML
jgi:chloride channel 7